jgi:hypothetical protein
VAERNLNRPLTLTRTSGALLLFVVGGVHFQLYQYEFYSSIPTIGPLFLVNFIAATVLGMFLLAPVGSRFGSQLRLLHQLSALCGIGVAGGALAALLVSERTPLFGFMEHGYRFAIVLAIASEAVAVMVLVLFLARTRAARAIQPTAGLRTASSGPQPHHPARLRPAARRATSRAGTSARSRRAASRRPPL